MVRGAVLVEGGLVEACAVDCGWAVVPSAAVVCGWAVVPPAVVVCGWAVVGGAPVDSGPVRQGKISQHDAV